MGYYLLMLIDTHAHLNFSAYKEDADEIIKRTLAEDIWIINVGSEYKTSQRAVEYAEKYEKGVYAAIGLHPNHLEKQAVKDENEIEYRTDGEEFELSKYETLAKNEKVVAIGEIGLDYFRLGESCGGSDTQRDSSSSLRVTPQNDIEKIKDKQKQVFLEQMDLAKQMDKPMIIHCREAYKDLIALLNMFQAGCSSCLFACPGAGAKKMKGVVHCFCGDIDQANQFLDLGLFLGFNGLITFSREYDQVVKDVPLEKILLETDCPYLSPEPHRGKKNEPLFVKYAAEKIAELKGIGFEQVAEQTTKNARELFGI